MPASNSPKQDAPLPQGPLLSTHCTDTRTTSSSTRAARELKLRVRSQWRSWRDAVRVVAHIDGRCKMQEASMLFYAKLAANTSYGNVFTEITVPD